MNADGSSDKNLISFYETDSGKNITQPQLDASGGGFTAAVKITSHCANFTITGDKWVGGTENVVDINNECENVKVACSEFVVPTGAKYALSSKTCNGVTFEGKIVGRPTQYALNLGSWSDQSSATQHGTTLNLTADNYPIVVWVGNAVKPKVLNNPSFYKFRGFGLLGSPIREIVMFFWGVLKKLGIPV